MLRSVVVDDDVKAQGIEIRLTRSALDLATALRVSTIYFLTTTGETFFLRFGFVRIASSDVPQRASVRGVPICVPFDCSRDEEAKLVPELPVACTLSPEALASRRQGLLAELLRHAGTHEELTATDGRSLRPTTSPR